jgi:hypothetical protein
MEVNRRGEDDLTQDGDWFPLRTSTAGIIFDADVSVNQELATCGVVGNASCLEKGLGDSDDDNEAKPQPVPLWRHFVHLKQ